MTDPYPPQELIERAWNQYAAAQKIHGAKRWTLKQIYGLFEAAVQIGWDPRVEAGAITDEPKEPA